MLRMEKERYFHIKNIQGPHSIETFNNDVLKITKEGKLELITRPKINLEQFEIREENGEYKINKSYSIKEVSKEEAEDIIREMDANYRDWQDFMTSSDEIPSSHLGQGGDTLY